MPSGFSGFPPEALKFLRDLKRNNRREWFQPRKEQFDQYVRAPMTDLVTALNAELARIAPEHVTDPARAIFRIYRDTRFSTDKTPYKTHIAARFPRRGKDSSSGTFYFSISADEVAVGGGVYHPDPASMLLVRKHVAENHRELRRILQNTRLKQSLGELQGDELRRMPKGFDPAHPAADLIRKKDWFLYATLDAKLALGPELFKELRTRFRLLVPVLEFLARPFPERKTVTEPPEYY
ncbi:MAG: DUF2461 domain-containing protein [Acidobacteriota bacterium]|nr:DUF2461 domain-containing protein [Acidobacteriota bacterium]